MNKSANSKTNTPVKMLANIKGRNMFSFINAFKRNTTTEVAFDTSSAFRKCEPIIRKQLEGFFGEALVGREVEFNTLNMNYDPNTGEFQVGIGMLRDFIGALYEHYTGPVRETVTVTVKLNNPDITSGILYQLPGREDRFTLTSSADAKRLAEHWDGILGENLFVNN